MEAQRLKLLMGFYFSPRGGSAHAARALAHELGRAGLDLTLLSGSRSDLGEEADARHFFSGLDLRVVDFAAAMESAEPSRFSDTVGSAPMHASYEDRVEADDQVFAELGPDEFELQVEAWADALDAAGAAHVDLLYLHHLTPLNEAAQRRRPQLPIVGHIHGSELLMLEQIARGPRPGWRFGRQWAERMRGWAARCERLVVNSPNGLERAAELLELDRERLLLVPNGFDQNAFFPDRIDRRGFWRRALHEQPRGALPGEAAGTLAYSERQLEPLLAGPVLLYCGRFTSVKRLPLLIEAFSAARRQLGGRGALVLLGGYPGEWEGEHPLETVQRTGAEAVYLAGWHDHEALPGFLNAGDVLVHASAEEQFGQVIVEAMACGVPAVAINRGGPASLIDDGRDGWLVEPDDGEGLAAAIAAAAGDERERARRGERARRSALERYTWEAIGGRLAGELRGLVRDRWLASR